jgi:hypothetical protein
LCQLTFIDTNDFSFNRVFLINALQQNAQRNHKDGWGYFTRHSGVLRYAGDASVITNIGGIVADTIKYVEPIIAHVRNASAPKVISVENSHPFQTDKLVLAHNGTLELDKFEKNDEKLVDSAIFLKKLDERYDGSNFVSSIQEAMKLFNGKFAFLIYSKLEKKFFVIRGETATLFKIDIINEKTKEKIGYVINTEKDDMGFSLVRSINLLLLLGLDYSYNLPVEEIPINSIFEVKNKELIKIGDLKETKRWEYNRTVWDNNKGTWEKEIPTTVKGDSSSQIANFITIMTRSGLSIGDIDEIFFHITGEGMLGASKEDIASVDNYIIKTLIKRMDGNNQLRRTWDNIIRYSPKRPYIGYNIQFPYILHPFKELRKIADDLKKEVEEKEEVNLAE